ncbi:hypothetical protein KKH27_05970 [bacterium]|nr:hypothetical protein [bacterium]MBU1984759.1 hypothetical protein [bacterium]
MSEPQSEENKDLNRLWHSACQGNKPALDELVSLFRERFSVILRLRERDLPDCGMEDVLQDTLLEIVEAANRGREDILDIFRYARGILNHKIEDYYRNRARDRNRFASDTEKALEGAAHLNVEDEFASRMDTKQIVEAIERLIRGGELSKFCAERLLALIECGDEKEVKRRILARWPKLSSGAYDTRKNRCKEEMRPWLMNLGGKRTE